jgi:two-component SAPR family response regulator
MLLIGTRKPLPKIQKDMISYVNFKSGQYNLAILDVLMDGIGGIELYKIMSNIDTNIRVCFLTGYDINASDYPDLKNKTKIVLKPVYLTQLLEIIRTLLEDTCSRVEIKN